MKTTHNPWHTLTLLFATAWMEHLQDLNHDVPFQLFDTMTVALEKKPAPPHEVLLILQLRRSQDFQRIL